VVVAVLADVELDPFDAAGEAVAGTGAASAIEASVGAPLDGQWEKSLSPSLCTDCHEWHEKAMSADIARLLG
jgi:hypothetical protein